MADSNNRRLLTILGTLSGVLVWAACSGGTEGPYVSGPGPGQGEIPYPSPPDGERTNPPPMPTGTSTGTTQTGTTPTGTTPTGTTPTGTGTGTGECDTCADVVASQQQPTNLCPESITPLNDLLSCMCVDYCTSDCTSFCSTYVVDATCSACANSYCASELATCMSN